MTCRNLTLKARADRRFIRSPYRYNPVQNPDAVRGVTQGCAVWSSGAWRFGRAMALPVIADLGL